MAGFEDYDRNTRDIEREIERKGIILGVDWGNQTQVRALAREALEHAAEEVKRASFDPTDRRLMAKVELFGLAALMLRTMAESADLGIESHGGPAWKAFAKALWAEEALRKP